MTLFLPHAFKPRRALDHTNDGLSGSADECTVYIGMRHVFSNVVRADAAILDAYFCAALSPKAAVTVPRIGSLMITTPHRPK